MSDRTFNVADYLIDHRDFDWPTVLREWTWMLPPTFTVWLMNRIGDLFLVMPDGSVHMLDIGRGTLERIANDRAHFRELCDREPDKANDWLVISLTDELVARNMLLGPGQCYSFTIPPIMGGEWRPENIWVCPIHEHFDVFGSIHHQIKDLPDGTIVELNVDGELPPQ
jgi:hypothetical protein